MKIQSFKFLPSWFQDFGIEITLLENHLIKLPIWVRKNAK